MKKLTVDKMQEMVGGELLTLTLVLTYMAIALVTIAVWKLFQSKKGKLTFPGGFNFEWSTGLFH